MAEGLPHLRGPRLCVAVGLEHLVAVLPRLPGPRALREDLHDVGADLRPPCQRRQEIAPGADVRADGHGGRGGHPGGWSSGHAPGGLLKLGSDVHDPWDQSPVAAASPNTDVMSVRSASA